jgi:hypothetical protein
MQFPFSHPDHGGGEPPHSLSGTTTATFRVRPYGMVPGGSHVIKDMEANVFAFLVCGTVALAFGFATLRLEMAVAPTRRRQVRNSSLGSRSVNWLGGISLAGALIICWLTQ